MYQDKKLYVHFWTRSTDLSAAVGPSSYVLGENAAPLSGRPLWSGDLRVATSCEPPIQDTEERWSCEHFVFACHVFLNLRNSI